MPKLLILILAVPLVAVVLEQVMQALDRRRFPAPGRKVDIGGFRLHLLAAGTRRPGQPTVVIEAGIGSAAYDWSLVQPEIARFARVCCYDRAGYGWSEPGPPPRTSQQLADELHRLLVQAGESGPYILVGHSFGGHIVRLFADQHPDDVAGMVLVDAREEDMRQHPALNALERANRRLILVPVLSRLGLLRVLGRSVLPPAFRENFPQYPVPVMFRPKFFTAVNNENKMLRQSDAQVRAAGLLGDIPLVVIRHGQPDLFEDLPPDDSAQAESGWQSAQDRLARLSTQGQIVVAEHSGHGVIVEQPEVIVDAVRTVHAAALRQPDPVPERV